MKKSNLLGAVCAVLFSLITVSANATLHGRLPLTPGGNDYQAAYDDVLNITWVTNASLSGAKTWDNLVGWASNLDYLGFDDWRLASLSVSAGLPTGTTSSLVNCIIATELDCRDNELGYMFYHNMDGSKYDNKTGDQTVDAVLLRNVQNGYWSGTDLRSYFAQSFLFGSGLTQGAAGKNDHVNGWAVRTGDVTGINIYINIPEGTQQECAATGGSDVTMIGNVYVDDPNEIFSILWYLDGDESTPVASGDTVEFFVPLGTHSVEAEVTTVTLGSKSDTESITIEDTIAPQVNPAFLDSKIGVVITSVNRKGNVDIYEGVVDTCDPAPTITSAVGLAAQEGDTLGIKSNKKDASISVTSGPNIDTVTLMVTATDASGNVSSENAVLTVTQ
jgi:hypothetical protein